MTTVNFKGKVYRVVLDRDLTIAASVCTHCAFQNDPDHSCNNEDWGGQPFSDGPAVGCIEGKHVYQLAA